MSRAVGLGGLALLDIAVLPQLGEDGLDDVGMLGSGRAAKDIEVEPEPVINVLVNCVILGAQFGRGHSLGQRLCLCCGAILVGTAHIERWQAPGPAEASKDVCGLCVGSVSDGES